MSAQSIFDHAPLGVVVTFSDGTPRPNKRHSRKLSAWETRNNAGRLVRKQAETQAGTIVIPASFTLHQGDIGGGGVILVRIHRTFSVASELIFAITSRPAPGSVLVVQNGELVHLAASREDAVAWQSQHGYPFAELQDVADGALPISPATD